MLRVLILGGTGDAAKLVERVANITGIQVISSLAGRTREPVAPVGNVRVGGFGGAAGLAEYLRTENINVLIDATHPFAAQISENAAEVAEMLGIPRLILSRPGWERQEGDDWLEVENHTEAAKVLENRGKRVFLTIGRQEIGAFAHLRKIWFLMRMIDPPTDDYIPNGEILCDRGPFTLENEKAILRQYEIDTIVSKNSGGAATYPKIIAARELGIPVIMVKRQPIPDGEVVADIDSAVKWLLEKVDGNTLF
ncbi:MAG TPA: cobalt-precorrin-6A reductase [Nostocaceae cyanobacterium]|nr:cobalt-precorrin-6A reductase [Nostocaceae cyanobacterium]